MNWTGEGVSRTAPGFQHVKLARGAIHSLGKEPKDDQVQK